MSEMMVPFTNVEPGLAFLKKSRGIELIPQYQPIEILKLHTIMARFAARREMHWS